MAPAKANHDLETINDVVTLTLNCDSWRKITEDLLPALKKLEKPPSNRSPESTNGIEVLSSLLPDGTDPLTTLNFQTNTLTVMYILAARCQAPGAGMTASQMFDLLVQLVVSADPYQFRLAPSHVNGFFGQILGLARRLNNLPAAVGPLRTIVYKYCIVSASPMLTPMHSSFAYTCLQTRQYAEALPLLDLPVLDLDKYITGQYHYRDNLLYHYYGGIIYARLNRYQKALEMFEICISAPGPAVAAVQIDAYKKFIIVSLIQHGKVINLPRYTSPTLSTIFRTNFHHYFELANNYHSTHAFDQIVFRNIQTLINDGNLGLGARARRRILSRNILRVTRIFCSMSIEDLTKEVYLPNSDEGYDELIQEISFLITNRELFARMTPGPTKGATIVEFFDDPETFNSPQIQQRLEAQKHNLLRLGELVKSYDDDMARSKDFLSKAMNSSTTGLGGGPTNYGGMAEEDLLEEYKGEDFQ